MQMNYLLATGLLMASCTATATDVFVEGGIHLGGDTLASTSGSYSQDLKAGQLLSVAVGIHTALSESAQARISIGYKFDSVDADNGSTDFDRVPLELLAMYRASPYFYIGAGVTRHIAPTFNFDISGFGTGEIEFDDANGLVFGFDYNSKGEFNGDWFVGGRVTIIDYETSGLTVSGNSVGAVLGFMFE